jgi:hypothetical protein
VRRALLVIVIAAVAALGLSASAGAGGKPLLIANCAKPKFEPKDVIIACGDASLGATGITWSSWTQKSAIGNGTGQVNDCTPDCVHGMTKMAPMQLTLSKPKKCSNGRRLFTKLRYTWTSGAPVGPASASIPFGCKLLNI